MPASLVGLPSTTKPFQSRGSGQTYCMFKRVNQIARSVKFQMQIIGVITWLAVACWQLCIAAVTTRTPEVLVPSDLVRATRVEKKADVRYQYCLSSKNVYTQFPDMAIELHLPYDQFVHIKYKIVLQTFPVSHIVTRVLIDGVEDPDFRAKSGNMQFHSCIGDEEVWLPKGRHYIQVYYRTPGQVTMNFWDWNVAYFKVRYYEVALQ